MNRRWRFCLLLLTSLAVTAYGCGDDDDAMAELPDDDAAVEEGADEELPEVDCDGDIPTFDEVAAFDVCVNCHSSELTGAERNNAEVGVNFDTYEDAKEEAMEAAHEVYEGEMPPSNSTFTLTNAEKEELYLWALCGAPE